MKYFHVLSLAKLSANLPYPIRCTCRSTTVFISVESTQISYRLTICSLWYNHHWCTPIRWVINSSDCILRSQTNTHLNLIFLSHPTQPIKLSLKFIPELIHSIDMVTDQPKLTHAFLLNSAFVWSTTYRRSPCLHKLTFSSLKLTKNWYKYVAWSH